MIVLQAIAASLGVMIFLMPILYPDAQLKETITGPKLPSR